MLLDEDPATLIAQCHLNFNITPDRSSLTRISSSLGTLSTFRQHQLSGQKTSLQKLSRQQQTLASTHSLTVSQHNPTSHASEILRLDTEKFKIAKQASDLEIEGERLQSELQRLGGVLGDLESVGTEGWAEVQRGPEEDAAILKLKVYRGLGFCPQANPDTGVVDRVEIKSSKTFDAWVLPLEANVSRNFYSHYLWDKVGPK